MSFLSKLFDQVNPFDNGKSFNNQKPQPASTAQPQQRNIASRVFDQINPLDNGRTFNNAAPTANQGWMAQTTNLANNVPSFVNKNLITPIVTNPLKAAWRGGEALGATIVHNPDKAQQYLQQASQAYHQSLPGGIADTATTLAANVGMPVINYQNQQNAKMLNKELLKRGVDKNTADNISNDYLLKQQDALLKTSGHTANESAVTGGLKAAGNFGQNVLNAAALGNAGELATNTAPSVVKDIVKSGNYMGLSNTLGQAEQGNFSPTNAIAAYGKGFGTGAALGGILAAPGLVQRATTALVDHPPVPLGQEGFVKLPSSDLPVNNPLDAKVGPLPINNPDNAVVKPLDITNLGNANTDKSLKISNPSNAKVGPPILGDNLSGAAQQSFLSKATAPFKDQTGAIGKDIRKESEPLPIAGTPLTDKRSTPFDTPEIVAMRKAQDKITPTIEDNSPARQELRSEAEKTLERQGGHANPAKTPTVIDKNHRADIVLGPPASGKTKIVDPLISEHNSRLVDSDEAKVLLGDVNSAGALHKESDLVTEKILNRSSKAGENIVMPLVGKNAERIKAVIDALHARGYDVNLHYNHLDPSLAAQRAVSRFQETGRFVDPHYVYNEVGLKPKATYDTIKAYEKIQSHTAYDNNVPKGEAPRLTERGLRGQSDQAGRSPGTVNSPRPDTVVATSKTRPTSESLPIVGASLDKQNLPSIGETTPSLSTPIETSKATTPTQLASDTSQAHTPAVETAGIAGTSPETPSPKLQDIASGSSKPKVQPNDNIVNTQPLSINVTSDIKTSKRNKTATDIRAAYTGDKNSQIVRGNQIADTIRKAASPEDRRAFTWLNEAGGNVGTLQKWLTDKSPNLDPHRADIQHAVDIANSPGKGYKAMQDYYQASGAAGVKLGSIKDTIENYNNRIYKQDNALKPITGDAKNPVLRPTTGHAKARTYNTLFDAVKNGKVLATTDSADLLSIHNQEMARVNATHKLTDALKSNNIGEWISGNKAPEGYTLLDGVQKTGTFIDQTGKPRVSPSSFAVPDYLASGFKAITEPDFTQKIDFLRKTGKYQGFIKTVDLSVSAFHHFTMTMQALYQTHGGTDLLRPSFWKNLQGRDFNALEQDFTAHTGMTSNVDANMDVMRALTKGDSKLGNAPGIKQVVGLVQKNNSFLFDTLQKQLKVTDYGMKISKWVDKHPGATNAEVTAAKRSIASEVNAAYGGLNWEAMGVSKSNVGLLRKVLLAPDWTISNLELGKKVFQGGPGGAAARAHVASAIIVGSALTEGLNQAITGHSSLQNGKGHEFEVEVRPGVFVSFFRGGIGDMLKLGSRIQQSGPASGPAQFLQGKLAPFARTVVGGLAGVDYNGQRFSTSKTNPLQSTKNMGAFIANSAGPVPFGGSNVRALQKNGITDPWSYGLVGTGIARPGTQKELQSVSASGDSQKLRNLDKNQMEQYKALPTNQQQAFLDKLNKNAQVNKQKTDFKTNPKTNSGSTTTSDGKIYGKVGNSYRTFNNQQDYTRAKNEQSFKDSGKNSQVIGDTYYYRTRTGGVGSKSKAQYDSQTNNSKLKQQRNAGDLNGYLNTAKSQLNSIGQQLKDPSIDPLEAARLNNEAQTLQNNIDRYSRYGGFSKGRTSRSSGGRGSRGGTRVRSARTITARGFHAPKISSGFARTSTLRNLVKGVKFTRKKVTIV